MSNSASDTLMISINLMPAKTSTGHKLVSGVGEELLALLEHFQIPATWITSDICSGSFQERLLTSAPQHALAVLATESPGLISMRRRFAAHLQQRDRLVQQSGLRASCLVLRQAAPAGELDLLAKHGIKSVMTTGAASNRSFWKAEGSPTPAELRYGIWHLPVTTYFSQFRHSSLSSARLRMQRRGRTSTTYSGFVHVLIDSIDLTSDLRPVLATVRQMCQYASSKAADGSLRLETGATYTESRKRGREAKPAVSILHKVA